MKTHSKPNRTTTICCVCGKHMSGPWPAAESVSHGYCQQHYHTAMQEIHAYLALLDKRQGVPQALAA